MRARVAAAVTQGTNAAQQSAQAIAQTQATHTALSFRDPELARFAELVRGTMADLAKRQAVSDELLAGLIQSRGSVGGSSSSAADATPQG